MNDEFVKVIHGAQIVFLKKDKISSIIESNDKKMVSIYMVGDTEPYSIELSAEQLFKLLHNEEFKGKMNEILKDS
jgi:hypothetical protein